MIRTGTWLTGKTETGISLEKKFLRVKFFGDKVTEEKKDICYDYHAKRELMQEGGPPMKKRLAAFVFAFAMLMIMTGCAAANAVQKLDAAEDRIEAKLDTAEEKLEESVRQMIGSVPETAPKDMAPVTETAPAAEIPPVSETVPAAEVPPVSEAVPEQKDTPALDTPPAGTEDPGMLTGEQARQIALDHLGFAADQVTRLHTEYEIDDRIPQFDVEFCRGDWEYEFEIHAETGKILSYDKDHKYD